MLIITRRWLTLQKDYLYLIRMTESNKQAGYQVMELLVENAISLILS
jgi:hypothetical protein